MKKIRRQLTNFKLLYSNINHLKSKMESLKSIADESKPTIIVLAETKLAEKEEIEFGGYTPYPMNRNEHGGGIMVLIKAELENIAVVVDKQNEFGEVMWITIANSRNNIRLGVVYAPQESKTKLDKLEQMYKGIKKQVKEAKCKKQDVLMVGDFNCKVGKAITGNTDEITKGGKLLIELVKNQNLKLLNASKKCRGLWTRVEGEKKSVLDYMIVDAENEELVKEMWVDEEKLFTPKHLVAGRNVYTDHNTMLLKINWNMRHQGREKTITCINEKTKREFTERTTSGELREMWMEEKETLLKFSEWNEKVVKIAEETFKKKAKKKTERKEIRTLKRRKKELKNMMGDAAKEEKELIKRRKTLIDMHIEEYRRQDNAYKTKCIAEKIKSEKGFDGGAFWDYLSKIKGRKTETAVALKNEEGVLVEEPKEILEIYQKFYEKLLTGKPMETEEGKEMEQLVNKYVEVLERKALREGIEPFTKEEYEEVKKEIKNGKAPDLQGWRYELVKNAGEDLEESILCMINELVSAFAVPIEWLEMIIKSIGKGKGDSHSMNSKRGLFLTNILSKVMEKLIKNRRKSTIEASMTPFQCGGVKLRGIGDNLLILNSVVEEFREEKEDLYLLFADLEKCFDQLWLKDCIKEMHEAGMPAGEAIYIYYMNKMVNAIVDTPVGKTERFTLEEIVRQGTVCAVDMCGVSTDRINKMGEETGLTVSGVEIKHPIFVDDMLGLGTCNMIKAVEPKMQVLEETKRFTFNNDRGKTEIMEMVFDKKKKEKTRPEIEVKKGKVGYTESYKYMGDQYDKTGKNKSKIEKKMEKSKFIASEVKRQGSYTRVGEADTSTRILLLEAVVKPTLLFNTETWINITKEEMKIVNQAHYEVLKRVFEQRDSTPYYGILMETGYWPFSYVIIYKRLMFFHHLIHSEERRISRKILINQMEGKGKGNTWYRGVEEWLEKLQLEKKEQDIIKIKKSEWKKGVKEQLDVWVKEEMKEQKARMTKLRFTNTDGKQEYIEKSRMEHVKKIMKVRLNMTELKSNFKGKYDDTMCPACDKEEETTEHVIKCSEYQRLTQHTMNEKMEELGLGMENIMENMEWVTNAAEEFEKIEETRKWLLGRKITSKEGENKKNKKQPTKN